VVLHVFFVNKGVTQSPVTWWMVMKLIIGFNVC